MKRNLSIILLIGATLLTTSIQSQNKESETKFIGELNPSIQIAKVNSNTEILDFDQGIMILYSEEINPESNQTEVAICLVDLGFKQFGKISTKQKVYLPDRYDLRWSDRITYNLLNFKCKVIDLGYYLIFIDYENLKISSFKTGRYAPSFYYNRTYFKPTNLVFSNDKGEFIIEYEKPTDTDVKIYRIFNKNGEEINIVKKNKKFTQVCSYFRGIGTQRNYYEENPDCAFNNNIIHAYARKPILNYTAEMNVSKETSENDNTIFIQFYKGNYIDNVRFNTFVYTYNFTFDRGRVGEALISLDCKNIIVNNKYIYSLPEIEITK